jgi:hypothetical protein
LGRDFIEFGFPPELGLPGSLVKGRDDVRAELLDKL